MTLLNMIIDLPRDKPFNLHCLADCTFLSKIFADKVTELNQENEQDDQRPKRVINMRGHQFNEEIVHLSETKLIYQIIGNGPVKHHQGDIRYIKTKDKHYLHYRIYGQSNTWVPTWLLKLVMKYDFTLMAKRLRRAINEC
ncbi:hypothetical protein [Thalassotalea profundi]|uniref:SRPBCC family protein n=1 Tax=Thalassotalea profundi TaxID=2036687 RepID=A0ABQ3IDG9_9GAMM|nr:hypothetical protein [Thalassotalea profundi]GHE76844.1 hypothetical protein GCM10011501_00230 [Thalassotalea profundi]